MPRWGKGIDWSPQRRPPTSGTPAPPTRATSSLDGDDPMSNGWLYMILASLGHGDRTSLLDGNIKAWQAARYPVVKGPATAAHGHLTVKTPPDRVVVDAPWVRDRLNDPGIRLLDVRSDQEWRGGMIPGAVRFRWEDLLVRCQCRPF